jgi:monoamine oxidase
MTRTRVFRQLKRVASRWLTRPASLANRHVAELNRRQLMTAGAALALGGCSPESAAAPPSLSPRKQRIAVVGGGLAGLYAAWRLDQALPSEGFELTLYEANTRVGGRVFTARNQLPDPKLVAELGGEFIDRDHAVIYALAGELGVYLSDRFPTSQGLLNDVFWLRDKQVTQEQLDLEFQSVAPAIQKAVDSLADPVLLHELDNTPLSKWLDDHVPARQYAELSAVLGIAYRAEFGLETNQQSALNLLYLSSFTPDAPFHLSGDSDRSLYAPAGNDTIATQLAMTLHDKIKFDSRLVAARQSAGVEDKVYTLTFETDGASAFEVNVERVIFALPFSVLRNVNLDGLGLSASKLALVESLGYGSSLKTVAQFNGRVWRTPMPDEPQGTRTVSSDLPFQQVWESPNGSESHGLLVNLVGGNQARRQQNDSVSENMAQLLLELEPILPGISASYAPGAAIRMDWTNAPFARGNRACFQPNQWSFREVAGKREGNLHFCGEHCSLSFPGTMEGAVVTGALVAMEILDELRLPYPDSLARLFNDKYLLQSNYGESHVPYR